MGIVQTDPAFWTTLRDLDAVAGVAPRAAATGAHAASVQETLF